MPCFHLVAFLSHYTINHRSLANVGAREVWNMLACVFAINYDDFFLSRAIAKLIRFLPANCLISCANQETQTYALVSGRIIIQENNLFS